jgi:hypothetical protein
MGVKRRTRPTISRGVWWRWREGICTGASTLTAPPEELVVSMLLSLRQNPEEQRRIWTEGCLWDELAKKTLRRCNRDKQRWRRQQQRPHDAPLNEDVPSREELGHEEIVALRDLYEQLRNGLTDSQRIILEDWLAGEAVHLTAKKPEVGVAPATVYRERDKIRARLAAIL